MQRYCSVPFSATLDNVRLRKLVESWGFFVVLLLFFQMLRGVAEQLMRRHVASHRGDSLTALLCSCALLAVEPALHPTPTGAAPPLGPLMGAGLPPTPGDAHTLLLLSTSLPWVSLLPCAPA